MFVSIIYYNEHMKIGKDKLIFLINKFHNVRDIAF